MSESRRLTMADILARRAAQMPPQAAPVVAIITPAPAPVVTPQAKPRPSRWGRARAEAGSDTVNDLLISFPARWPASFTTPPRPLALGIHHAIRAAMNSAPLAIELALHDWTTRTLYLTALAAGGPRYGLDGQPDGTVSAPDRAAAATQLAKRKHRS